MLVLRLTHKVLYNSIPYVSKKIVRGIPLVTCFQEMPSSVLSRDTDCPDREVSQFPHCLHVNASTEA
jgi:hypothetical protein